MPQKRFSPLNPVNPVHPVQIPLRKIYARCGNFQGLPRKDLWKPFLDRVRHIVTVAKLYGQRDEFYFDGRYPGGMGIRAFSP
jgi:hypothetical protein